MYSYTKPRYLVVDQGHPLTRGLETAWAFFEGSGTTVRDVYKYRDGSLSTSPAATWVTSELGVGVRTPSSSWITRTGNIFNGTAERTVVWYGIIHSYTTNTPIYSIDDSTFGLSGRRWTMRVNSSTGSTLRIELQGSGFNSSLNVPTGQPTLCAITFRGTVLGSHRLYVNNRAQQATGANAVDTGAAYSTWVHRYAASERIDATAYLLLEYSRQLADDEIFALYDDPFVFIRPRASYLTSYLPVGGGVSIVPAAMSSYRRRRLFV